MAVLKRYKVAFQTVKVGGGGTGLRYAYRNPVQVAHAAGATPAAAVAAVTGGNIASNAGETFEIVDIHEETIGVGLLT